MYNAGSIELIGNKQTLISSLFSDVRDNIRVRSRMERTVLSMKGRGKALQFSNIVPQWQILHCAAQSLLTRGLEIEYRYAAKYIESHYVEIQQPISDVNKNGWTMKFELPSSLQHNDWEDILHPRLYYVLPCSAS